MDPIVHPGNYEISHLLLLGKKRVPWPSLTLWVVSGNKSRPTHRHVLLPDTSLALPVNTFQERHHFKRGETGIGRDCSWWAARTKPPFGEGASFSYQDVPDVSLWDHRTGLFYLLEEMSFRD